jgi:hypothetical protein
MFGSRIVPLLLVAASTALSGGAAFAQAPVPEAAKAAMTPLAWLVGRWSGEGTHTGQAGTQVVHQTEDVRPALEGSLLVVEGTGREPGPDGEPGDVVFRAFAVLSAGDAPGRYRFAAWNAGRFVDAGAEVAEDGTLTWGFETPDGGRVEYVIRRPEPDVWHEEGSYFAPGQDTGRPFFEMTLHRETPEDAR